MQSIRDDIDFIREEMDKGVHTKASLIKELIMLSRYASILELPGDKVEDFDRLWKMFGDGGVILTEKEEKELFLEFHRYKDV
jgi:hypothetical protein